MAKSVKEELQNIFSGKKKPNVFYKGLNTDTDAHAIGNDQYVSATNVRLSNSEQDSVTLQNIKSDVLAGALTFNTVRFAPDQDYATTYPYAATGHNSFFDNPSTSSGTPRTWLKFKIKLADGTFEEAGIKLNRPSSPFYDKVFPDGQNASHKDMLGHILHEISEGLSDSTPNFNDGIKTTISPAINLNGVGYLNFQSLDSTNNVHTSAVVQVYWSTTDTDTYGSASWEALVSVDNSTVNHCTHTMQPLAVQDFGDFIAIVGTTNTIRTEIGESDSSAVEEQVVKVYFSDTDAITSTELVVEGNFGYSQQDAGGYYPLKMVKVDENSKYRRIYFTDGVEPVKTVNLEATASFYSGFDSSDDFNLFSKSPLKPIEITTVIANGNVNSGSWSYCYKLISGSGSGSVVSPITNPLPLFPTSLDSLFSDTVGADIGDNSNKSVSLTISDIDTSFDKIQLIGIHYLDNLGSAAFYQLKEERLGGQSEITLIHNGNETTTAITAFETLVDANTWDVAQDLAVKDNRLFASNLTNSAFNIPNGSSLFRVKQYKHTGAASRSADTFDGVPDGGAFTAHDGLINPDLDNPLLYIYNYADAAKYRYAEGPDATSIPYYGASTPSFFTADTGIQITFKQKQFTLDDRVSARDEDDLNALGEMTGIVDWWSGNNEKVNDDYFITAPFYGPTTRDGEDGYFDNYQSPIFTNKYTGYMRGEVYRFAIQFYDKQGNNTFSYPIGDIKMPEVMSDYRYNTNPGDPDAGTHIAGGYTSDGGVVPPAMFGLCSDEGAGQVLYPHFVVKLSEDIRNQISGFNIVRAEINDGDETVRLAGILNHTLRHRDYTDQKECKNRYGLGTAQLFDPNLRDEADEFGALGTAVKHEMYTIDSPDITLGKKSFNASGSKLMVVGQLKPYRFKDETHPNYDGSSQYEILSGTDSVVNYGRAGMTDGDNWHFNASVYPTVTVEPNGEWLKEQSHFSKYYSDTKNIILNDATLAEGTAATKYLHDIHYSQNVSPREVISPTLLADAPTDNDGFVNSGIQFVSVGNTWSHTASGQSDTKLRVGNTSSHTNLFWGNTCHFINLASGAYINGSSIATKSYTGSSINSKNYREVGHANEEYFITSKLYVKIIRDTNAGRYGGNSKTVFEKQRWINTGASLHGNDVKPGNNNLPVFGGDTYVNYHTVSKKFDGGSAGAYTTAAVKAVQGMIYPVESKVNVDMRRGRYFGKDRPHLNLADEHLYAQSYSAENNIKSFPAKDSSIPEVNNFPQTIAVSNIKIAGQTTDSFARFDANESYDVDANYGAINNLVVFRNELFALQSRGVVKLDVNTKSLIKDELGQQITIASGTGAVISDDTYVSATFGSQHRMNSLSTEKSFYWIDHNNSTICRLGATSSGYVAQDLLAAKFCRNLLKDTRRYKLNNAPLLYPASGLNDTTAGGIHIYNDVAHGEIGFSINYGRSSGGGDYITLKHIVFSETLDCFVTEREHYKALSFLHKGVLFYMGAYDGLPQTATVKKNIYTENVTADGVASIGTYAGTSNPIFSVGFVNNEDVSSIKVFDKLVASYDGTSSSGVFTKFTFTTNHNTVTLTNPESFVKTILSKDIFPVISNSTAGRVKGNYLNVTVESTTTAKDINIWSYITHHRKTLI